MVECAIDLFIFVVTLLPIFTKIIILSCQEKKVMRLVLSIFLFSPSISFLSEADGLVH